MGKILLGGAVANVSHIRILLLTPVCSHPSEAAMTVRFLAASAALLVAPAALAAGPGSTPDWAAPQAAPARSVESVVAPPTPPPAPQPVPVDGGLTLLAIAGAGYAAKKLRARASA